MFKHFIGKIYILDKPPVSEKTQLDISFPDEILGDLDEKLYENVLTKEQAAKIIYYQEEMSILLGEDIFNRLKDESAFQSSNADLIKSIAVDMVKNPETWNGLGHLNSPKREYWDNSLYKIINLKPGGWETKSSTFVAFIKALRDNWYKTIPELLSTLEPHDISIDDFFKLERTVSFKFASLLKDVNTLQKEILKNKNYDISRFVSWTSHAFLPSVVYQLEEYGLPRMITKKIHHAKVIDFIDKELNIHSTIALFKTIGMQRIISSVQLDDFDRYILTYFYEGIRVNNEIQI